MPALPAPLVLTDPEHFGKFRVDISRYPILWQGRMVLKNEDVNVDMRFVTGNPSIASVALPALKDNGRIPSFRIYQRMPMEDAQLMGVLKRMEYVEDHCVLMTLPSGDDDQEEIIKHSNYLSGLIQYFSSRNAAGIVDVCTPGTQEVAYTLHIFPPCQFTDVNLTRLAPILRSLVRDIPHMVVIIAKIYEFDDSD